MSRDDSTRTVAYSWHTQLFQPISHASPLVSILWDRPMLPASSCSTVGTTVDALSVDDLSVNALRYSTVDTSNSVAVWSERRRVYAERILNQCHADRRRGAYDGADDHSPRSGCRKLRVVACHSRPGGGFCRTQPRRLRPWLWLRN